MNWSQLTVFDLDRTIVADNCSLDFCRYLVAKNIFPPSSLIYSFFYYVKHLFFGMSLSDLHLKVFEHLLCGKSLEALASNV